MVLDMTTVIDARKTRERNKMNEKDINDRLDSIEQELKNLWGGYEVHDKLLRRHNDRLMICEDKIQEELGLWDDAE